MRGITVQRKCVLIRINKLYRPGITKKALYEATRGTWSIGPRREQLGHALAIYKGIVKEVYQIEKWFPAGTLQYKTRKFKKRSPVSRKRWEFKGIVAHDIRNKYVGKSVRHYFPKGAANPIIYTD